MICGACKQVLKLFKTKKMEKNSKTILVTGCAGFIGSNFVKTFLKRFPKIRVAGIDDFSSGKEILLPADIEFYRGSITDGALLEDLFSKHKPSYVFHFGAIPRVSYSVKNPAETTRVNIYGTSLLLEKCRDHNATRFIFSSSSSVYGGAKKMPTKESQNPPNPQSPYAMQKLAGELLCKQFSKLYGLETICLRYFNVFGPGQYGDSPYSTVISAWLENLFFPKGAKPFIEGDGSQSRDFSYVDNVVEANIKSMQLAYGQLLGQTVNIACGSRTNLLEVKKLIERFTGRKIELEKRPPRLGDVYHTQADLSLAKRLLGYKPIVQFKEGLKKTIEWYNGRKE